MTDPLYIAKAEQELFLLPRMANRHGLVAGATGTGKTVTLQTMAENFSRSGVPVFCADVKGDLSGISQAAGENPKVQARIQQLGLTDWTPQGSPVVFWDVYGEKGHPVRTTISDMGPLLLARLLNLNDTQGGVLSIIFKIADDKKLLLLDLKDLRAMVKHVGDHAADYKTEYGNISPASIGAIQRGLLQLEEQDADKFFGEPALNLDDLIQTDANGNGVVNILVADKLIQAPKVYATMLLWLLAELFEDMPEVGDVEKPKIVFFFDEAHLLFDDAPEALTDKIEQVVRLIRSKGIGIYFVTRPKRFWDNSAIAYNMRCARSRRATKKPSKSRRKHFVRIRIWIYKRPLPNWAWAKRLCRFWMKRGRRASRNARSFCRRVLKSARLRRNSAKPFSTRLFWREHTSKSVTANRRTSC